MFIASRITSFEPLLRVLRYRHFALVHRIIFGGRSKIVCTPKQISKRYTSFRTKSISLLAINRHAHCHLVTANFHVFRQGYAGTGVTPSPDERTHQALGMTKNLPGVYTPLRYTLRTFKLAGVHANRDRQASRALRNSDRNWRWWNGRSL